MLINKYRRTPPQSAYLARGIFLLAYRKIAEVATSKNFTQKKSDGSIFKK